MFSNESKSISIIPDKENPNYFDRTGMTKSDDCNVAQLLN